MKAIYNGKLLLEDGVYTDKVILFDSKIHKIIPETEFRREGLDCYSAEGCYISPGFIDIHIHGAGGFNTMDGTTEALNEISKSIIVKGTTSFLPTTMSMSSHQIYGALDSVEEVMARDTEGAQVLGVHMEGPFISKEYKGAQNEKYIISPAEDFLQGYEKIIKIITIAPEIPGALDFIKKTREKQDIMFSLGHSGATFEESQRAIAAGVSHVTHLFNAMPPLHHRNPGIVGAAFSSQVSVEFIADNIHINPALYQLILQIKGREKTVLVTDAMRAACLGEGEYDHGGLRVFVKNKRASLQDGTLAGSILTLDEAVRNIKKYTRLSLFEIVKLASLNPAKVLNISRSKGSISPGKDADLIIFDEGIQIKQAFVNGKLKYFT